MYKKLPLSWIHFSSGKILSRGNWTLILKFFTVKEKKMMNSVKVISDVRDMLSTNTVGEKRMLTVNHRIRRDV